MNLWTKDAREKAHLRSHGLRGHELRKATATVDVLAELLGKAVNRLRNQGGDISEITYKLNMDVVREAEDVLEKVR